MPIVIFLAVMFATVGLAFLLENIRPPARRRASRSRSRTKTPRNAAPRRRMSSFTLPEASAADDPAGDGRRSPRSPSSRSRSPSGFSLRSAAAGVVVFVTLLAWVRPVYVGWHGLLAGLILVILFVPIRRYTLPGNLPFELEPYRLLVIVLLVALGRIAPRRSARTTLPPHRLRGAADPDLRLDRRLARRQPEPRRLALVAGAEGPDVPAQLRARPLHDGERRPPGRRRSSS